MSYIHVYIYVSGSCSHPAANLRTKILDFRGLDSSRILILWGALSCIARQTIVLRRGKLYGSCIDVLTIKIILMYN